MQKKKLKKFTAFAESLFPHEVHYLQSIAQFEDPENELILEQVAQYVGDNYRSPAFSTHIDKRKYSRIMRWMEDKLQKINVDATFDQMIHWEQQLMHDSLQPEEEKKLIAMIQHTASTDYYFMKRYELAMHLLNFLLVRLRHKESAIVSDFTARFKTDYDSSRMVYSRIQDATVDITHQYSFNNRESRQWESWLLTVFRDPKMDGMNRYYALVRLIFLYYNYDLNEEMEALFEEVDPLLEQGVFYSRRILINYYGNRLLYHSRTNQLELAEKFGYLSIRGKTNDFLHYVNNLSAVLLKKGKTSEALKLMKEAFPEMKNSPSFHQKTSFVAFYVRCLCDNQQVQAAISHAEIFLNAYRKELLQYRWHLFFTVYLRALLLQHHARKALQVVQKYDLLEREQQYLTKITSLATIEWYYHISLYIAEKIELPEIRAFYQKFVEKYDTSGHPIKNLEELKSEMKHLVPTLSVK